MNSKGKKLRLLSPKITFIEFRQNVKTGGCAVLSVKDRFIYYLVTKDRTGGGCYPTYSALESSLKAMREHIIKNGVKQLAMPTIGCGLDRLQWDKVEGMLRDIFQNDDIIISVYKFTPK